MSGKLNLQNPVYLVLFVLMIISCPNDQMRDLVELKVSDPLADTFIINSGDPTAEITVTLNSDVTKEEDALEMRFKNEGYSWSDWEAYSPSKTWTLPLGDGFKKVYAEYRDEGHHVVSKTYTIELNTGAPSGDFYIWGTAISGNQHEFINTLNVDLCMNITNIEDMRFSNDGGTTWSSWIPYATTYPWTLSEGDGAITVNAEFRTNAGITNSATNSTLSENPPILDTTAPTVSDFIINSGDASANNTGAELTYNFTDANNVWTEYRNDSESWSTMEAAGASPVTKSWTLRAEAGTRTAEARLTDIAGNVSSVYSDDIYLDTAAPAAPIVSSSETYTASTLPEWTWNSVPGAVSYRYNLDNTGWSEEVPFTSYTPGSDLAANTSHTLYVRAVDSEGRESESGSFTVYIDTEAPVLSGMSLNQTYYKTGDTVVFNFTAEDLSGVDISGSMVLLGSKPLTLTNISGSAYQAAAEITGYLADGTYPVEIDLIDPAGNYIFNSFSAAVIDNTQPVISDFRINNGNTYSCSPYGRVSITATDVSDLSMQLTGTSSTSVIPYADSYDIQNSGTVTGEFTDEAGNVSSAADSIIMKTTEPEDTRYENQSMPSHLGAAAYDLGNISEYENSGGDAYDANLAPEPYEDCFGNPKLLGKATLWDEDWYKLYIDKGLGGYYVAVEPEDPIDSFLEVEAFENIDGTISIPDINPGNGLRTDFDFDAYDNPKIIWIRVRRISGSYDGASYNMRWGGTI